jgi:hypothetical protein
MREREYLTVVGSLATPLTSHKEQNLSSKTKNIFYTLFNFRAQREELQLIIGFKRDSNKVRD